MGIFLQFLRKVGLQGKIDDKIYGMALYEFNITWKISTQSANLAQVLAIEPLEGNNRLNNIK